MQRDPSVYTRRSTVGRFADGRTHLDSTFCQSPVQVRMVDQNQTIDGRTDINLADRVERREGRKIGFGTPSCRSLGRAMLPTVIPHSAICSTIRCCCCCSKALLLMRVNGSWLAVLWPGTIAGMLLVDSRLCAAAVAARSNKGAQSP
jgi:hypothetical protein